MPRVIFKCPYLKGGSERAASHLHNYVRYMATRKGAQRMTIGHEQLPATAKQQGDGGAASPGVPAEPRAV